MNKRHAGTPATLAVAFALSGCGGGGGGGGGGGTTPPPAPSAPAPTATVTIAPSGEILHNDYTGVAFTTMAEGTVTATNLAAGEVIYLRLRSTNGTLAAPPAQVVAANQVFRIPLRPTGELTPGNYAGQIEYTACRDAQCNSPYGPSISVAYKVNIWLLGEWETIQRDSTHSGFVPTTIDTTRLNLLWEWRPPAPSTVGGETFITRPATTAGGVAVLAGYSRADGTPLEAALYSIGEYSGKARWTYTIPAGTVAQAPASVGLSSQILLPTVGGPNLITSFDGDTGAVRYGIVNLAGTGARTLAPTSFANLTFFFAGTGGEEIHSIDNNSGLLRWGASRTGRQSGTPAVRSGEVLFQSGNTIEIRDILYSIPRGTITDPSSDGADSAFQRPVVALGSRGNVVAVSYNGATGAHPLSSFNIENRRWEWSTSNWYQTFAVSGGVIYAYREGAPVPTLDAIDEATGLVQWSWTPPPVDGQVRTTGNIMLTQNLVFISTESNGGSSYVWAIDRTTRQPVWRYPNGGYVLMSGSRTIYVLSGPGNGRPSELLRAFRIK